MIGESIFVCGEKILSHPVSFLFHFPPGKTGRAPDAKSLKDKKLVLADCRNAEASDIAAWASMGLEAGKPVLLLCPGLDTIKGLQGKVGILPEAGVAALLVSSYENSSGLKNYDVATLEYSAPPGAHAQGDGPSDAALENNVKLADVPDASCACTDFDRLSQTFVHPKAADDFKIRVERAMGGYAVSADISPPTGLKYFLYTYTPSTSFTYNYQVSNTSAGSLSCTYTVWGFLNQTQSSNSQYLVVQARFALSPGGLHSNDECDRGYGDSYLTTQLTAPMSPQSFVPTSGDGSFSGTVTIPISYKSPTGGYQIWDFSASVNYTVSSWSCKSVSSGSTLGAQWWMTSPCNGTNISGTYKDAFSFWGHVSDLTAGSTGTLEVSSISSWVSNTILSGTQTVSGNMGWQGVRLNGESCSPGVYWKIHWATTTWSNPYMGFSADFGPIQP